MTTNIGLKLTYIPPGSFTMGTEASELGAKPAEKLQKVTISKGFYMGIHEVTQDQYLRFMGKNPSVFQGEMLLKNKRIVETMEPGVVGYNHPPLITSPGMMRSSSASDSARCPMRERLAIFTDTHPG